MCEYSDYMGSKEVSASSDVSDSLLARGTGRLWIKEKIFLTNKNSAINIDQSCIIK